MDANSDSGLWLTAEDIATLAIPGYPRSSRRIHDRAEVEGWRSRQVPSQGRTGSRREYQPPPAVLKLIRERQLLKSFNEYRMTVGVGKPLQTAISDFVNDYNTVPGIANFVEGLSTITEADVSAARGLSQLDAGSIDPVGRKAAATRPPATNHAEVMAMNAGMVARCVIAAVRVLGPGYSSDQATSLGVDTWGVLCRMFHADKADRLDSISDAELERLATFVLNTKSALSGSD